MPTLVEASEQYAGVIAAYAHRAKQSWCAHAVAYDIDDLKQVGFLILERCLRKFKEDSSDAKFQTYFIQALRNEFRTIGHLQSSRCGVSIDEDTPMGDITFAQASEDDLLDEARKRLSTPSLRVFNYRLLQCPNRTTIRQTCRDLHLEQHQVKEALVEIFTVTRDLVRRCPYNRLGRLEGDGVMPGDEEECYGVLYESHSVECDECPVRSDCARMTGLFLKRGKSQGQVEEQPTVAQEAGLPNKEESKMVAAKAGSQKELVLKLLQEGALTREQLEEKVKAANPGSQGRTVVRTLLELNKAGVLESTREGRKKVCHIKPGAATEAAKA